MLFRGEGIDLAAPVRELAASDFLIDFERNIIYHMARFTADSFSIFCKVLGAEGLDSE